MLLCHSSPCLLTLSPEALALFTLLAGASKRASRGASILGPDLFGKCQSMSPPTIPFSPFSHLHLSIFQFPLAYLESTLAKSIKTNTLTLFRINTYESRVSVASKELTESLSSLDSTFPKNRGDVALGLTSRGICASEPHTSVAKVFSHG